MIYFNNSQEGAISYALKMLIRRSVIATLDCEGYENDCEISVTLTDNEGIHALNKQYRNIDRTTDVLSFPLYEDGDFSDAYLLREAELGDIVISLERAKEQACELGHGFLREVAFLAIHSTLHLLGYDHERSPEDDEEQCRRQREIIKTVEI
jgi:probable rRNA maturation factor